MTLPEGVDEESIKARFEDGVLEVTIEEAAAVREPKRIQIEGSSDEGESTEGEASGRGGLRSGVRRSSAAQDHTTPGR
jgi:HSP20 family protein